MESIVSDVDDVLTQCCEYLGDVSQSAFALSAFFFFYLFTVRFSIDYNQGARLSKYFFLSGVQVI